MTDGRVQHRRYFIPRNSSQWIDLDVTVLEHLAQGLGKCVGKEDAITDVAINVFPGQLLTG